jgi:hypothetical protein
MYTRGIISCDYKITFFAKKIYAFLLQSQAKEIAYHSALIIRKMVEREIS